MYSLPPCKIPRVGRHDSHVGHRRSTWDIDMGHRPSWPSWFTRGTSTAGDRTDWPSWFTRGTSSAGDRTHDLNPKPSLSKHFRQLKQNTSDHIKAIRSYCGLGNVLKNPHFNALNPNVASPGGAHVYAGTPSQVHTPDTTLNLHLAAVSQFPRISTFASFQFQHHLIPLRLQQCTARKSNFQNADETKNKNVCYVLEIINVPVHTSKKCQDNRKIALNSQSLRIPIRCIKTFDS